MMKRLVALALVLFLAGLACSTAGSAVPTSVPTVPSLPATTQTSTATSLPPIPTIEATVQGTTPESELNPPPVTIPAPGNPPLPAAPARHHPGDAITLDEIHMSTAMSGWAISGADVLVTSDGAQTWREVTPPQTLPADARLQAQAAFFDPQNAWVVFSINDQIPTDAVVWHTADGGNSWTASAALDHQAYGDQVWAEFSIYDATHLWLLVRGVYVGAGTHFATQFFRTEDGGVTWLPLAGDIGVDYTGLVFSSPDHGLLTWQTTGAYAPSPPEYALTSDGALNWDSRELPPPPDAPDLFETSPYCEPYQPTLLTQRSARLLVGCFDEYDPPRTFSSYLYSSDDAGSTWTSLRLPQDVLASAASLVFFTQKDALLLGQVIYRTKDGGATWEHVKSVNWDGQFSFVDPQTGWAVARSAGRTALVETSNGGATWTEIKPLIAK